MTATQTPQTADGKPTIRITRAVNISKHPERLFDVALPEKEWQEKQEQYKQDEQRAKVIEGATTAKCSNLQNRLVRTAIRTAPVRDAPSPLATDDVLLVANSYITVEGELDEIIKLAKLATEKETEKPTYCEGCSPRCQATECECICHDRMDEYKQAHKKCENELLDALAKSDKYVSWDAMYQIKQRKGEVLVILYLEKLASLAASMVMKERENCSRKEGIGEIADNLADENERLRKDVEDFRKLAQSYSEKAEGDA